MTTLVRTTASRPGGSKFEITETYLLSRPEAADAVLNDLRSRGIRIALDDFGTGYASIGYLRRFQFDLVKLDRTLVEAVVYDPVGRRRVSGHRFAVPCARPAHPGRGGRNRRASGHAHGTMAANISRAGISVIPKPAAQIDAMVAAARRPVPPRDRQVA